MVIRCFLLLVLVATAGTASALDPRWKFHTLTSAHFELFFREDQRALAKRYILAAERAHELLLPIFKEGPSSTKIILQDDTDSANGLADFLPYPHIVIYPVLPTQGDSVDDYGDWPLEVMIHEYAHILNMYPAHGIYRPLKYIFGSVVRPNAVLPRWYLEGLAVDLESGLSTHGRLRAADTTAVARAYTLGDKWKREDIATINEQDGKTWPYGARPYLFGGWWWGEAHKRKGHEAIYALNQNYSRRLPFFINGPVREQLGASVGEFFHQSMATVAAQAQREIDAVNAAGGQTSTDLLDGKGDTLAFALSPSGQRLVYWLGLVDEGSFAFIRERENATQPFASRKARKLFRTVGTYRVSWINENSFLFDQVDAARPHVAFRDLYRYDLKTDTVTRLTNGVRAQDAAVSPNGLWIAYIQNDGGRNKIGLMEITGKNPRILIQSNYNQRLSSPEFVNDGEVLFTGRTLNGDEKIYSYNLGNKRRQVWNSTLKSAQSLRRTRAGIFVSDAGSGIRNIYRVNGNQVQPLTNTFTAIQVADYDPLSKSVIASELTPDGPRLKTIALQASKPARIERTTTGIAPTAATQKVPVREGGYWPIKYMFPRYLIPMIYPLEEGLLIQGITSGQDPLERNILGLSVSYDTVTAKPSYGVNYLNQSLPTSIGLGYSNYVSYLGASGRIIEAQDAALDFGGHVGSRFTTGSIGGIFSQTEGPATSFKRMGPTASLGYKGTDSPYSYPFAWYADAFHQQFLAQDGYLAYGRSYLHLGSVLSLSRHKLGLQLRSAVSPDLPFRYVLDLGERSVGGNYLVNLANSTFLLRGYPSGAFVGRKMVNGNLEWVMPASEISRGFGTFPLFLRNVELAAFVDTMAVDGAGYHTGREVYVRSKLKEFYTGAGGELRLNTSVAYHVPMVFTLGAYYGFKEDYGGGFIPFLGIGLGGLSPISKKTP